MNIIHRGAHARRRRGQRRRAAADAAQRAALQPGAASTLTYGLRPEALRFADDGLPGTLRMTEPTGPETYATVETAVGLLTLRVPGCWPPRSATPCT